MMLRPQLVAATALLPPPCPRGPAIAALAFLLGVGCLAPAQGSGFELWHVGGDGPGQTLGWAVTGLGDVNGDGWGDLLATAPLASPGGVAEAGCVRAFSGADGSLLYEIPGVIAASRLGLCISRVGDVNGDQVEDFVVGARQVPASGVPGSAWVFSGRTGAALFGFVSSDTDDAFGSAVASAADVDADGTPDLLVGAPLWGGSCGRAVVYSGTSGGLLHAFTGGFLDYLGRAVAGVGDADGDGRDDVLVGAPSSIDDGRGRAMLHSGATGQLLHAWTGPDDGSEFGSAVTGTGDLDGDGRPDVLIGAPFATLPGPGGGLPECGFLRALSGASGQTIWSVYGSVAYERLGLAVAGAGDLDGDGIPDVCVSTASGASLGMSTGEVQVRSGADGSILMRHSGLAGTRHGQGLAARVDVDTDGMEDIVIGAPWATAGGAPQAGVVFVISFGPVATATPDGPPRVGATSTVLLSSPDDPGLAYIAGFSSASYPGLPLGDGRVVPLAPGDLLDLSLRPGNPFFLDTLGTLDHSGQATVTLSVPALPSLVGTSLVAAFAVIETAPPHVGRLSPAVHMTVH